MSFDFQLQLSLYLYVAYFVDPPQSNMYEIIAPLIYCYIAYTYWKCFLGSLSAFLSLFFFLDLNAIFIPLFLKLLTFDTPIFKTTILIPLVSKSTKKFSLHPLRMMSILHDIVYMVHHLTHHFHVILIKNNILKYHKIKLQIKTERKKKNWRYKIRNPNLFYYS